MNIKRQDPDRREASGRWSEASIIHIGEDRRQEAVGRLLAPAGKESALHARRFLDYASSSGLSLENLWSLVAEDGRILATVLAAPNPGRTALLFATHARTSDQAAAIGRLIDHACNELTSDGLHLAQVLLEPKQMVDREAFLAGGLTELAVLSYLQRPVRRSGGVKPPVWPADVRVETYDDSRYDDLLESLRASYEKTLDCPGLTGLREVADILEGHRATGQFDPALWSLLYVGNRPSGSLLLNPATAQNTIELVYVGLALPARGRGLGRSLLRHGLSLLIGREERTITVAVDERNTPAMALYRGEGFQHISRRVALIRSLRPAAENPGE